MENIKDQLKKISVHRVLARSYTMFFAFFLLGICLDFIFKVRIFTNSTLSFIGFLVLILASALIFWAQKTSSDLSKIKEVSTENFCHGPYCYTRSPTHWGLFFLMVGFGVLTSSFFVILTSCIALLISKYVFLDKEERVLEAKYGNPYMEYKKLVRF